MRVNTFYYFIVVVGDDCHINSTKKCYASHIGQRHYGMAGTAYEEYCFTYVVLR